MSVPPTATDGPVHHGLIRYALHVTGWMISTGLACYGSVVYGGPHPSTFGGPRPRYWRREARGGLLACERYLEQLP